MIYTKKIKDAIRFSIKTHEVYQKQKRKGKDVAYITHPLTAGIILARAGADEDTVVAGILHDTIEDSPEYMKVTQEMIAERFGGEVNKLVLSVTEQDRSRSWEERKKESIEHIKDFSYNSILLKSADIISNTSELIDDYERDEGDRVFTRFGAPKEKILEHYQLAIGALLKALPANPLANDLRFVSKKLEAIARGWV